MLRLHRRQRSPGSVHPVLPGRHSLPERFLFPSPTGAQSNM